MRIFINMPDQTGTNKTSRFTVLNCTDTTQFIRQVAQQVKIDKNHLLISLKNEIVNLRVLQGWPLGHYGIRNGSWVFVQQLSVTMDASSVSNKEISITTVGSIQGLEKISQQQGDDADEEFTQSQGKKQQQSQDNQLQHDNNIQQDPLSNKSLSESRNQKYYSHIDYFDRQLTKMLEYVREQRLDKVALILKQQPQIQELAQMDEVFSQKNTYILNQVGECGRNALHWAIHNHNIQIVSFLLMKHCNPNVRTIDEYTPLQLAIVHGCVEIVQLLLEQPKIDANKVTSHGTALHLAAYHHNIKLVRILLDCGANPEQTDLHGKLPWQLSEIKQIRSLFKEYDKKQQLRLLRPNISKGDVLKITSSLTYRYKCRAMQINPFKDQLTLSKISQKSSNSEIETRLKISTIDEIELIKQKKWLMDEKLQYVKILYSTLSEQDSFMLAFRHKQILNKWISSLKCSIAYVNNKQYVTKIKPQMQLIEVIDDNKNFIKVHKRQVAVLDRNAKGKGHQRNPKANEKDNGNRQNSSRKGTAVQDDVGDILVEEIDQGYADTIQVNKYKYSIFEMNQAEQNLEKEDNDKQQLEQKQRLKHRNQVNKQKKHVKFEQKGSIPSIHVIQEPQQSSRMANSNRNSIKPTLAQEQTDTRKTTGQKFNDDLLSIDRHSHNSHNSHPNRSSSDDMRQSEILLGSIINQKSLDSPFNSRHTTKTTIQNGLGGGYSQKQIKGKQGNMHTPSTTPNTTNFRKKSMDLPPGQSSLRISEFSLDSNSQHKKINFSHFQFIKQLGSGAFGQVYLCQFKEEFRTASTSDNTQSQSDGFQRKYAMKVLNKKKLMQKKQLKYAVSQTNILKKVSHPFIIQLHFCFQTPSNLYIALDYCKYGDLSELLCEKERLSQKTAKFLIAQLILAIQYLHEMKVLYRDLKPQNILIAEDGFIKLIDFGLSKENNFATSFCGSPAYLSPQMLQKKGHSFQTDIYGIGCVLYEIVIGEPPYFDQNMQQLFQNIKTARLKFPGYLSKEIKSLISKMLERDIKKRIGVADMVQIKKHQFFKNFPWDKLKNKQLRCPKEMFPEEVENQYFKLDNNLGDDKIKYMDQDYTQNSYMINRIKGFSFSRQEQKGQTDSKRQSHR